MKERRLDWYDYREGDKPIHESKAFNKDVEYLGFLQYEQVGRHFHYCWYQDRGIMMSPGCLQEVRDKQKELLKKTKTSQKRK